MTSKKKMIKNTRNILNTMLQYNCLEDRKVYGLKPTKVIFREFGALICVENLVEFLRILMISYGHPPRDDVRGFLM